MTLQRLLVFKNMTSERGVLTSERLFVFKQSEKSLEVDPHLAAFTGMNSIVKS